MLLNWLVSRLCEDSSSEIEINLLYDSFTFECKESGSKDMIPAMREFVIVLNSVYPTLRQIRRREGEARKTSYKGIAMRPLDPILICKANFADISQFIPENAKIKQRLTNKIVCSMETDYLCNKNTVTKTIILHDDSTWELNICEKNVDLNKQHVANTYSYNKESISTIFSIVEKIQLCEGIAVTKNIIVSRFHTLDNFQKNSTAPSVRSLRSAVCTRVIPFGSKLASCSICKTMTFTSSETEKENKKNTSSEQKLKEDGQTNQIKHLLNHGNPELVNLFLEQSKNISKDPRGRRWSKSFIGTCLQLYNRSPHSYELLIASKLLILPSTSTLVLYKNRLKQEPGFDNNMFEWMLNEAKRRNIPEDGMIGGLIFDEMSIQSDIQISKCGGVVELVGFTDIGEEGDNCHALRKGKTDKTLGDHILQLLFLGVTGFRFPFAHFITDNVQASELYGIFWKSLRILWTYGFKVLYTCMDGAVCNRSFMHLCVGEHSYLNYKFLSPCSWSSQPVIFMMDISHVLKKIRNNIIKSGITKNCTRLCTLPTGFTIQWPMFTDCYLWDQQNALQLHRKLTRDHMYPDSQLKMRNYLAEDVLDKEMLNLMQVYQQSLGEKGQVLNGVIEFLEQTAELVLIFRDMRPITCKTDPRLSALQRISTWFLEWEKHAHDQPVTNKEKLKLLLSAQCHEDIQSCLQGFNLLCNSVIQRTSTVFVTPALVNSDVIENIFNQQRSTYNGANTNPNALQYRKTINSVLIGQNTVSRKSNAGQSIYSSTPYTVEMPNPKRKKKIQPSKDSKIKVIRI